PHPPSSLRFPTRRSSDLPGLAAREHFARWAPSSPAWDRTAGLRELWVGGLAQGVVRLPEVGIGGHPRPPAWRPLNHGLLRGQLRSEEHTSELQSRVDLVC